MDKSRFTFITFFLCASLFACQSTRIESQSTDPFSSDKTLKHAAVGISIQNCETGQFVYSHNGSTSMHPASVLKLITTASALEMLGPDFRFKTQLLYDGKIDEEGVLHGDLVILGGGDPTLGSEYVTKNTDFITTWIDAIQKAGIKTVDGNIVADVSSYEPQTIPSRWVWEDIGNYYGAAPYGLSAYDNRYRLFFRATKLGQIAQVSHTKPYIPGLSFTSTAKGGKNKRDSAYIYGDPLNYSKTIVGTIPTNKMDFSIKGAMPNPPLFVAQKLTIALQKAGISTSGNPELSTTPTMASNEIIGTYSPPLIDIIKGINYQSNNLFAEHLLVELAGTANGLKSGRTGINNIRSHWRKQGLNVAGIFMYDGSGLAPANAVDANFITTLLTHMQQKSRYSELFVETLPLAGQEGSVLSFLKGSNLQGAARVKSGSMDRVRCYAGYIRHQDTPYSFTIFVNHFNGESIHVTQLVEHFLETQFQSK